MSTAEEEVTRETASRAASSGRQRKEMSAVFRASCRAAGLPKTCVCCGEIIEEEEMLCDYCREMILRCDPLKRCRRCGMVKRDCVCNSRLFFFNGCIAPFVNTDFARDAMYRFKFASKLFAADFFAREMALCVVNEYRDITFDAICYVPMFRKKQRKRGYNQSRLLAEKLAEILHLPVRHDLLICRRLSKPQHELDAKRRMENVLGLYACKGDAEGATLLLVDDIKTTGATLNECAKQLVIGGASAVWCVTALATEKRKTKGKEGEGFGNRDRN